MSQSIEVVIPVHDPARPLERGLASTLGQRAELSALGVDLRVTVVCHNIPVDGIKDSLPSKLATNDAVTWLGHADGIKSPAGPRNAALDNSSATFLSFLDSDDYLEPGSLAAWWKVAIAQSTAAVIAPLRTPEGSILRSPRIRPSKPAILDPIKDGLAYRSVPYGLLRRSALLACGFRYAEGIATGEDIEATLKLWFRAGTSCYPYGAPAYCQTNDSGPDRVTSVLLPLAQEFAWLGQLLTVPWALAATESERRTIALKILRVHGIGALHRRAAVPEGAAQPWNSTERSYWAALTERLCTFSGGSLPALSRRDAALCRAAAKAQEQQQLRDAVVLHEKSGRKEELLTEKLFSLVSRDSVLRHYVNERLRSRADVYDSPFPAPVAKEQRKTQ
ncbi:glycosyltransferase family A protein [Arthrobacter sp. E3]|uniref:glycosyltransferase family A protein n=1 Tax=Arthrobacter sp. E3 TaxID=517402 RepID=UPI001A948309|nr:glycosyltransferase family A protein [Arthrobacter sp. E3]